MRLRRSARSNAIAPAAAVRRDLDHVLAVLVRKRCGSLDPLEQSLSVGGSIGGEVGLDLVVSGEGEEEVQVGGRGRAQPDLG